MLIHLRSVVPFLFMMTILFSSCENKTQKAIENIVTLQKSIEELGPQNELAADEYKRTAAELISAYAAFTDQYPENDNCPAYLFDAGSTSISLADYNASVVFFDKLVETYPTHELAPDALYHTAYVYEKFIQDLGQARSRYLQVIKRYPDLAKERNVALQIEYLGNDEALFNALQQQIESQSGN